MNVFQSIKSDQQDGEDPLWMTTAAAKLKKKKYRAWKRYKSTGSYENYEKYVRKGNAAQNLSNKLRTKFEKLIAKEAKTRPKSFWAYVKNQTKSGERLGPLLTESREMTNTDTEKAHVLNSFFSSVFTHDDLSTMTDIDPIDVQKPLIKTEFLISEVEKELTKMKSDKSPGPDSVHPRSPEDVYTSAGYAADENI